MKKTPSKFPARLRDVTELPRSFNPAKHRSQPDTTGAVRFLGKVLGRRDGFVFVETERGVYQFAPRDIRSIRPLHTELDMVEISGDARFVMNGTIAQELVAEPKEKRLATDEIRNRVEAVESRREVIDTLGGLGVREWRG